MGCPAECFLGDNLVFSCTTHNPSTAAVVDADSVPVYWVYEDETGVSINASTPNSDNMAKLDDAHTTGFYSESIAVTAANGFEINKTYTVYIEGTVGGVTGAISYNFKINPVTSAIMSNFSASASTIVQGTVSWDNTASSTTVFYCDDITEATADHFNGRIVIFTSGVMANQASDITNYALVAGEGQFTVTALTEAPPDNTTFVIV